MITLVVVAGLLAGLAAFGAWFVGRLGEIDRQGHAERRPLDRFTAARGELSGVYGTVETSRQSAFPSVARRR